jgi:hypothetical protein
MSAGKSWMVGASFMALLVCIVCAHYPLYWRVSPMQTTAPLEALFDAKL